MAKIHTNAFPGFFLTSLGPEFLADYYKSAIHDSSSHGIGLWDRGALVGFAIGYPDSRAFYMRLLVRRFHKWAYHGLRILLRHPTAVAHLLTSAFFGRTEETVSKPPTYILLASIAVDAPHLSAAGTTLLKAWEASIAIEHDFRGIFLTTDKSNNSRAIHFYTKNGYRQTEQFTTRKGRTMIRFEKELAS
ncbi:GNAT family N-acetyltransferase [Janibacter limosus]|uniref:GNAT family N-acetyltransferase n=1 Tax=Janibacter limosus TaxID=53458 RepID=UPI0034E205C6